jgi:hypothetical protein
MKLSFFTTIITVASAVVSVSGSYARSCRNCRLDKIHNDWLSGYMYGVILICECDNGRGGWPTTKKNLNECLINSHGNLIPWRK